MDIELILFRKELKNYVPEEIKKEKQVVYTLLKYQTNLLNYFLFALVDVCDSWK